MAIEPPATYWSFPDPDEASEDGVVGVGADLEPGTVLEAYRTGIFPMPIDPQWPMVWWSPDPRGVLETEEFRLSRSLRKTRKRYEVRLDTAFDEVLESCADPSRANGWIDERIKDAYLELHRLGWAHSVECWDEDGLAGGLYGLAIGGLFAGESMFYRRRDASKAALAWLVERMAATPCALLDVQWVTPHLESLGAHEVSRHEYLDKLDDALEAPSSFCNSARSMAPPQ